MAFLDGPLATDVLTVIVDGNKNADFLPQLLSSSLQLLFLSLAPGPGDPVTHIFQRGPAKAYTQPRHDVVSVPTGAA